MGLTPTQRNFKIQMDQLNENEDNKFKKDKSPKSFNWLVVLILIVAALYYSGAYDYVMNNSDIPMVASTIGNRFNFKEKETVYNYHANYTKLFNSINGFSNEMLKDVNSIPFDDLNLIIDRLDSALNYFVNNNAPDFLESTNEITINQISASLNYMNGILKYKLSNDMNDYNRLSELSKAYNYWNKLRREDMISNFEMYGIMYEINDMHIRFWMKK